MFSWAACRIWPSSARRAQAQVSPHGARKPDGNIFALVVAGTNLYVAGNFSQLGAFSRNRLGRVSTLGAGDIDPVWDPNVTGGNLGYPGTGCD